MLAKDLEKLGLNEKETQLYLGLLELGEATIARLAEKSGIKRTTCYDIIDSLKGKGLVGQTTHKKKTIFLAEDPRKMETYLEEKKDILKNIMPELLSVANFLDKKPRVRYFEGLSGIKDAYRDTLKYANREILAWASPQSVSHFDYDWFWQFYLPKRAENRIWMRVIVPETNEIKKFTQYNQKHLRKVKFVPAKQFPFEVEINLYGKRNIAIMAFEEKIAMIIESEKVFNTLKSIFELNWNSLLKS